MLESPGVRETQMLLTTLVEKMKGSGITITLCLRDMHPGAAGALSLLTEDLSPRAVFFSALPASSSLKLFLKEEQLHSSFLCAYVSDSNFRVH